MWTTARIVGSPLRPPTPQNCHPAASMIHEEGWRKLGRCPEAPCRPSCGRPVDGDKQAHRVIYVTCENVAHIGSKAPSCAPTNCPPQKRARSTMQCAQFLVLFYECITRDVYGTCDTYLGAHGIHFGACGMCIAPLGGQNTCCYACCKKLWSATVARPLTGGTA